MKCPDCGNGFEAHNAVNWAVKDDERVRVAHHKNMGTCWKSLDSEFTEQLLKYMKKHPEKYEIKETN